MSALKTFKMRIDEIIDYLKITRAEFERRAGLSNGYTRNLGGIPGADKLESILTAFPIISRTWLLTGMGEMLANTTETDTKSNPEIIKEAEYVGVLPMEALTSPIISLVDNDGPNGFRRILSPIKGAEWVIQISGDSMEPEYKNGGYLFIKRSAGSFIPWGNTMVVDTKDGVVIKNIFPVNDNEDYIEARSLNPQYPPFKIEKSTILGMYRILAYMYVNATI